ncbi:MAG TPA: DUF2231 domain-containing protein [Thermomicrobiales bacterium]
MESRAKILGHPIHQMLIPFPLGLLGAAVIFDLIDLFGGSDGFGRAADHMIPAGIVTGLVAAVFGAIDWLAIPSGTRAKRVGLAHGLGNVGVVACFAVAWLLRRDTPADPGSASLILQVVALVGALITGWLGGELVDRLGVGVDPDAHLDAPSSLLGKPARSER